MTPFPPDLHLPTLLPMGGYAITVGAVGDRWSQAVQAAVGAHGRSWALAGGEMLADTLDRFCARERMTALHLVVIGSLCHAGRVLSLAEQSLSRFAPAVVLLGGQRQVAQLPMSLLENLLYEQRRLHDDLAVLFPAD